MWLRLIVSSWMRQQGRQALQSMVVEALRGKEGAAAESASSTGQRGERGERGESELPPRPPCVAAFLFAMELEASGFVERLTEKITTQGSTFTEHDGFLDGQRVLVGITGVGAEAAYRAAGDFIAVHRPPWIVSAGFAGGLVDSVRRGHFVMPQTIVMKGVELRKGMPSADTEFSVGLRFPEETLARMKSLHTGRLVSVDRVIREEAEKRRIGQRCDSIVCDMETWAVAAACAAAKTRFLAVRVVTDAVDDPLPVEIENLLEQKSVAGKLGAIAGALLNRPSSVKDMWKLYEEATTASERLGKFLASCLPSLRTG
jgi:adenosylhomocysteine nucleosidase